MDALDGGRWWTLWSTVEHHLRRQAAHDPLPGSAFGITGWMCDAQMSLRRRPVAQALSSVAFLREPEAPILFRPNLLGVAPSRRATSRLFSPLPSQH